MFIRLPSLFPFPLGADSSANLGVGCVQHVLVVLQCKSVDSMQLRREAWLFFAAALALLGNMCCCLFVFAGVREMRDVALGRDMGDGSLDGGLM